MNGKPQLEPRTVLALVCFLVLAAYGLMIDLKGISSDEGIRLAIMNGGAVFPLHETSPHATWDAVLAANSPYAYQPLYFLLQNSLMRVAQTHDVVFLRLVNLFFLWVCLQGLLKLSAPWRLGPRVFLLLAFSFNAYLFMHVLQIREYVVGVAWYIWSTVFVLRLDERELGRKWADAGWFAAYGILLTLGYYTQSWIVLPAIAQFVFLAARARPHRWRFLEHLALSLGIVLALTLPYLLSHPQKIDIGRWGKTTTAFWPQLADGFHLVLTGHLAGRAPFATFLFWFWLVTLAVAAVLVLRAPPGLAISLGVREIKRQGTLALICILFPLAFQVGYFLCVDDLSLWPRYFVIHYFYAVWLLGLGFAHLCDRWQAAGTRGGVRRILGAAVVLVASVMVASGVYQSRSYYLDPLLDSGQSQDSNWRSVAAGLSRASQADDVVVAYDFIFGASLTYTRPIPNRVVQLKELESADLRSARRLLYLEAAFAAPQRAALAARLNALGFCECQEIPLRPSPGQPALSDWRLLAFSRR